MSTLSSELAAMRLQAEEIRRLRQIPPTPRPALRLWPPCVRQRQPMPSRWRCNPTVKTVSTSAGTAISGAGSSGSPRSRRNTSCRPAQVVVVAAEGGVRSRRQAWSTVAGEAAAEAHSFMAGGLRALGALVAVRAPPPGWPPHFRPERWATAPIDPEGCLWKGKGRSSW